MPASIREQKLVKSQKSDVFHEKKFAKFDSSQNCYERHFISAIRDAHFHELDVWVLGRPRCKTQEILKMRMSAAVKKSYPQLGENTPHHDSSECASIGVQ